MSPGSQEAVDLPLSFSCQVVLLKRHELQLTGSTLEGLFMFVPYIHMGLHEVRATHILRISWSFASEVRFVQG